MPFEKTLPEVTFPTLLRFARHTYGGAMRRALEASGYDDIPDNGLFIIGCLGGEESGIPINRFAKALTITKQAAGQLVDTLVMRGYLLRTPHPDDRRQLVVSLAARGHAAAAVQLAARMEIDTALADAVGAACVAETRRALAALIALGAAKIEGNKA